MALFAASALALLLMTLSIHWALMPLCLWMLLMALRMDWALQQRMVVPPLAVLVLWWGIGMGVGIPMFLSSQEIDFSPPHLIMQLVFLFGAPFLFLGYYWGRGSIPNNWSPRNTEAIFDAEARPLIAVGMFFMLYDLIRLFIAWRSGGLDRGYAGEAILDQGAQGTILANLFGRWNGLWFFFLPFLWRKSGLIIRISLIVCLGFYGIVVVASGSRGLLLFPIIFGCCGLYFFSDKLHFKPERWGPILLCLFAAYIYLMDVYRNTAQFQESKLTDVYSRLSATKAIVAGVSERQDISFTIGRALIGVSDDVIYQMTPNPVPYAGAGDIMPALAWTWVPHLLAPNKPLLWDSNEVAVGYTNNRQERSFSAISLSADLFRRFSWGGIPIGLFVMGLIYGYMVNGVIFVYRKVSVVAGVTFFAFIVGAMQYSGFTSTVLQTWWIWAYDLPKHLIPLVVLLYLIGGGMGKGLDAYSGVLRRSRLG